MLYHVQKNELLKWNDENGQPKSSNKIERISFLRIKLNYKIRKRKRFFDFFFFLGECGHQTTETNRNDRTMNSKKLYFALRRTVNSKNRRHKKKWQNLYSASPTRSCCHLPHLIHLSLLLLSTVFRFVSSASATTWNFSYLHSQHRSTSSLRCPIDDDNSDGME